MYKAAYDHYFFLPDRIITNNSISGLLPLEIGNLSKLVVLDLSKNAFDGVIPDALVHLTSLVIL
jgi:somatic embryogenesis receptor kinase 1